MAHYNGVEWGKDSRFYVNVLVHTNQGRGGDVGLYTRDGSTDWEDAEVKAKYWIWIPGQAFADSLHGVLSSGSISYEAVQAGKSILAFTLGYHAGMFDGVKDALTDVVELIGAIWEAIASLGGSILDSIAELWDTLTNLDAEALLDAFLDRWNAPDPWEKWNFRGWLIGFAIMMIAIEVLLALVTGGAGNAARWSAKAAKLGKLMDFLKGLGVVKKLQAKVRAVGEKIPGLGKLRRIGDEGTDAADKGSDAAKAGWLAPKSWAKFNPEIADPCLVQPVSVRALIDATSANDQVARALRAQDNPVLAAARREALEAQARELTAAKQEALEAQARQSILDLCDVLAIPLTTERRARMDAMTSDELDALRSAIRTRRRWPEE